MAKPGMARWLTMEEAIEGILKQQQWAALPSPNADNQAVKPPLTGGIGDGQQADESWADGSLVGRWRQDQPYLSNDDLSLATLREWPSLADQPLFGGTVDRSLASPLDAASLMEVDWKREKQRREWEQSEGRDWPRTADGRRYDRHHITPKAHGGSEALDNIKPMDPLEHRRHHMESGDFRTWGSWARGKKPNGGSDVKGLGLLGIIPDITGILSGRIRTDTFDNFASDMMGVPSQEDRRKAFEAEQRRLNPKWKPGDPFMI